jgi:hypothetical protein
MAPNSDRADSHKVASKTLPVQRHVFQDDPKIEGFKHIFDTRKFYVVGSMQRCVSRLNRLTHTDTEFPNARKIKASGLMVFLPLQMN